MANPLWINWKESTHGVNGDGYPDVSNRPARAIWANLTAQHNKDGTHKSAMADADLSVMESYTYTGDGTDNRTISLQNANLEVHFLRIFSDDKAYTFFTDTNLIDGGFVPLTMSTEGYAFSNYIQALGTGDFQVGSADQVNKNAETFYYIAYGQEV